MASEDNVSNGYPYFILYLTKRTGSTVPIEYQNWKLGDRIPERWQEQVKQYKAVLALNDGIEAIKKYGDNDGKEEDEEGLDLPF